MKIAMLICFAIIICSCGALEEAFDDPCTYEVGDIVSATAYRGGYMKYLRLSRTGCEGLVVFEISGQPIFTKLGDTLKLKVIRVKSPLSYVVRKV